MRGQAILHTLSCFLGLSPPHSQTTIAEQKVIAKYASGRHRAVEIGVYEGVNTTTIAKKLNPAGQLFGIDPFFKGKLGICYHELITRWSLRKKRLNNRVVLIPKLSYDAVLDVPGKIDFLFIDGDHSWEGIERDWLDWMPKVGKGGYILLHDTHIPHHDLNVAKLGSYHYFERIIKYDPNIKVLETVDSLNVLEKITP